VSLLLLLVTSTCVLGLHKAQPGGAKPSHVSLGLCSLCCSSKLSCPAWCPPCRSASSGQCPYVNKAVILCPARARNTCKSDASCPGDQRCCDTGCSRNCSPVCPKACRPNQRCLLPPARPCLLPPCPQPRPRCVTRTLKPGQCPITDIVNCVVLRHQCRSDKQCGRGQRCCDRRGSCGRVCSTVCRPACRPGTRCRLIIAPPVVCRSKQKCPPPQPARAVCQRLPNKPGSCNGKTCPPGRRCRIWRGQPRCEVPRPRPGRCPALEFLSSCLGRPKKDTCVGDFQCARGQRCCRRACGRRCTPVCLRCSSQSSICELVTPKVFCVRAGPPCVPAAVCRPRTCSDITCGAGQRCVMRPGTAGPICQSVAKPTCKTLHCPPGTFCQQDKNGVPECLKRKKYAKKG